MPQIANLRLLLSTANHHSSPLLFSPFRLTTPSSLFHVFKPTRIPGIYRPFSLFASSSSKKQRYNSRPFSLTRRKNSSLREIEKKMTELPTEENESVGFNRKRAAGRDNDKPKTLRLKVRKLNPVNTICYVQVLGTGMDTQDTSPSVLLFFDKQRFIFNAGEGLQRFCTEHKIKLSKIDHIFLSRVCSETAGGLPGLLLTLAGIGDEGMSVNIWGPSDFKYLVDAMKSFIPSAAMVHTRSFGSVPHSNGIAIHDTRKLIDPIVLIDDEVVKISAILLLPASSKWAEGVKEEGTMSNATGLSPKNRNNQFPELLRESHEHKAELALKPGDMSVIYVCELPEIKGKFDPKKAAALGLRPGPKYRELQLGNSVKSDHQDIMVHPCDVLDPSVPGPIVLLVDCPTSSHMQQLLSTQSLNSYYADASTNPAENSKTVNCVIHLTPASLLEKSDYQRWMSRFSDAQHIMAGHEMKNIEIPVLKSSARIAARLNYLCPQFFPAPGFWSLQNLMCSSLESKVSSEGSVRKLCDSISAENLLKFNLRPYAQLGLDRSSIPTTVAHSEIISELLSEIPETVEAAQQVAQFWCGGEDTRERKNSTEDNKLMIEEPWLTENEIPSCLEGVTREEMEIVLLGTGSSQPSKYRNVSSVFINLFEKGSLLLDCGEGTLGQLKRRFGINGADDAVRGLKAIWISHIHADHHTGLARLLALRRDLLKEIPHEPLIVIGPRQLKRFLDAYERLEDLDMQFLDCRHTTESALSDFESNHDMSSPEKSSNNGRIQGNDVGPMEQPVDSTLFAKGSRMESYWKRPGSPVDKSMAFPLLKKLKKVLGEAGLQTLISFPVIHCPHAFGVALRAADRLNGDGKSIPGWKVVYSGDTRPCPELIKASHGATVLIHEATFEDGLLEEAIARNHSTTKEAIEVGDFAGAYRIILTHFSQRYPKIPVFDDGHMHKTCIAFDMMSVNLADLPILPNILPYLRLLFRNEMVVDEQDDMPDGETAAADG